MFSLIIIVCCLVINAYLASIEIAFVTVSRAQIRKLVREGNAQAARLLSFRDKPERTLSILQVGITLVGAISAAAGGAKADEWLAPWFMERYGWNEKICEILAITLIVIPLTYVNVVLAELVPKNIALKSPLKIALKGTFWLVAMDRLFSPFVSFLESSTAFVIKLLKHLQRPEAAPAHTESSIDIGALSEQHKQYVVNLVNLENKQVRDILVPWKNVNRVLKSFSAAEVHEMILQSRHTRLPVCENDHVVGLLHSKEFLALKETGGTDWNQIIRPAISILGNTPLLNALRLMQTKRSHMSIVFSREGQLLGVVTLEDIIEEVVGDIFDEDDDGALKRILGAGASLRARR